MPHGWCAAREAGRDSIRQRGQRVAGRGPYCPDRLLLPTPVGPSTPGPRGRPSVAPRTGSCSATGAGSRPSGRWSRNAFMKGLTRDAGFLDSAREWHGIGVRRKHTPDGGRRTVDPGVPPASARILAPMWSTAEMAELRSPLSVHPPPTMIREGPPTIRTGSQPGPPRLLDRVWIEIRTRHYSRKTEKAYVGGYGDSSSTTANATPRAQSRSAWGDQSAQN